MEGFALDIKSSGPCPSGPSLTNTDKGVMAVGVVLGVLILGLGGYLLRKWWKSSLKDTARDMVQRQPDNAVPIPGTPRNLNAPD